MRRLLVFHMATAMLAASPAFAAIEYNPLIPSVHSVISPAWSDDVFSQPNWDGLMTNMPEVPYTYREMTEWAGSIPDRCYENNNHDWNDKSEDRTDIKMYEVTFADSKQPLTLCFQATTKDTMDKQLTMLSRFSSNSRSVWRLFASYRGTGLGDSCACFTIAMGGAKLGTDTFCYGPCSGLGGVYTHEFCNAANSYGDDGDNYNAWVDSKHFAAAYNKDTKQVVSDRSYEYWSTVCKMTLYDVNVPGGLQKNMVPLGLDLASVQNQVTAVKQELAGLQRANQTWFRAYDYGSLALVDKSNGHTVVSSTTVKAMKPEKTDIPFAATAEWDQLSATATLQTHYVPATTTTAAVTSKVYMSATSASLTTATSSTTTSSTELSSTTTSSTITSSTTASSTTTSSTTTSSTVSASYTTSSSSSTTTTTSSSSSAATTAPSSRVAPPPSATVVPTSTSTAISTASTNTASASYDAYPSTGMVISTTAAVIASSTIPATSSTSAYVYSAPSDGWHGWSLGNRPRGRGWYGIGRRY